MMDQGGGWWDNLRRRGESVYGREVLSILAEQVRQLDEEIDFKNVFLEGDTEYALRKTAHEVADKYPVSTSSNVPIDLLQQSRAVQEGKTDCRFSAALMGVIVKKYADADLVEVCDFATTYSSEHAVLLVKKADEGYIVHFAKNEGWRVDPAETGYVDMLSELKGLPITPGGLEKFGKR